MKQRDLCPLCKAGITQPLTPDPQYAASNNRMRLRHPGYPQSRLCAIDTYCCRDGSVELIAWDPSETSKWNQKPPQVLVSHRMTLGAETYIERPRVSISLEQLTQAGLALVLTRTDTPIWHYEFRHSTNTHI